MLTFQLYPHHFGIYVPTHLVDPVRGAQVDAYTASKAIGCWRASDQRIFTDAITVISVYCNERDKPLLEQWVKDYAHWLMEQGELSVFAFLDGEATLIEKAKVAPFEVDAARSVSSHKAAGVQPHSQGGIYPYVLVFRDKQLPILGSFDGKYDTGVMGPHQPLLWFTTRDAALAHAVSLLTPQYQLCLWTQDGL